MTNSDWLANYYQRIQADSTLALGRRDSVTNWSYTVLAATIAAYVGFFGIGTSVIPLGRFGLIAGSLFVLIRFFFQSMVAYGYFLRARYLRTEIEKYWMDNNPTLEEIKQNIKKYDHGKTIPTTERNRFLGQVRSGFILILIIPIIPLVIEFSIEYSWKYFAVIAGLAVYVLFEIYNFVTYDQMKVFSKK
ncbi:Hypothetical protein Nlim_1085 [Candidatus Nitrosarchaeum limnium SFB1]|jgi:hypothetical protein|uniref:Uncharacterized protein n=1 Tax=Candidatus Nitrosarchaeum limnium SFB1 TaxID=886738 RepID=F3KKR1_9ARCH|nr:Hypothetical protein Nlim_1085 [Candidatus Nitrosarchaeum limnium SFB1]